MEEYIHKKYEEHPNNDDLGLEYSIMHDGKEVLVFNRDNSVTVVPGYIINKKYAKTEHGLFKSQIQPIPIEKRRSVENLVKEHWKKVSQKVYNNPDRIQAGRICFWNE
jgi:hypothetical protein